MSNELEVVLLRIKFGGLYVMGKVMNENDRIIDLEDACILVHRPSVQGTPEIFFSKYCPYTKSFDVGFKKDSLSQIFRDPLDGIVDFYFDQLDNMKDSYGENRENKTTVYKKDEQGDRKIKFEDDLEELTEMIMREYNDDTIH